MQAGRHDGGGPVAEQTGRTSDAPHHGMVKICKVMLENSRRSSISAFFLI
jgi:hypothetical protein